MISIIIPAHNAEGTIRDAVQSVLWQDEEDYEALVVLNGCTDRTRAVAEEAAAGDARFRFLTLAAGDLSAALNAGAAASRGSLVAFLDADDVLAPCFLSQMAGLLEYADTDIAVCRLDRFRVMPRFVKEGGVTVLSGEDRFQILKDNLLGPMRQVKMYRRETLAGVRFPEWHVHEDEYAAYDILKNAGAVALTDAVLYGYREQDGSITRREDTAANLEDIFLSLAHRVYEAEKDGRNEIAADALRKACADAGYRYAHLDREEQKKAKYLMESLSGMLKKKRGLLTGKEYRKFRVILMCPGLLRLRKWAG